MREFPKCATPSRYANKSRPSPQLHTLSLSKSKGRPDKFGKKSYISHRMPKVGNGKVGGNRANTGCEFFWEAMYLENTRFRTQWALVTDRAASVAQVKTVGHPARCRRIAWILGAIARKEKRADNKKIFHLSFLFRRLISTCRDAYELNKL